MNNLPLEISPSTAEESRSLIIAKYPVRLLHYAELGVILGCLLVLGIHSIEKKSPRWDRIVWEERVPEPMPITPPNPGEGENPDRDGDGIPNEWETTHSHNPDLAADAASDFDNDGLTALQEYQLWIRTSGQAGKPLGNWQAKEIPIGQLPFDTSKFVNFYQYGGVTAANDRGDILLGFQLDGETINGQWEESQHAAFLMIDGSMNEIKIPGKTSGFTYVSDINEQGEILLQWFSDDRSECESYFLKNDNSVTQITLDGNPCFAYRMNNFGDWVGYKITENQGWQPVHVVDGMPMPIHQSLTSFGFSDINDYGQIIGYYFDWLENRHITFTQLGSQFFSTGQNGGLPRFDESLFQWQSPAAINNWGEFTGGLIDVGWRESSFFFDGSYKLISGPNNASRSWPVDLSKNGMVLFGVASGDYGIAKPYLWRDSVTVVCDALFPEAPWNSDGGYINANKLTSEGKIFYTRYDAYNLPASILVLTPDQDSDGDGMPDDWEEFYGFNPNLNDANLDSDGDGTNNLGEFLLRSDPHAVPDYNPENELIDTRPGVDTDGDGIPNNWEVVNGMNYEDPSDAALDFDRDGYTNLQEFRLNTDPRGAPAYRIRQIGPFSGVSGVDISKVTLSEGSISGNPDNAGGDQMAEEVFFTASITPYTSLPVMWSQPRTEDNGVLSFYPSATEESRNLVAHSPSGAVLTSNHYYPKVFTYWSKHNADPVTFTAIENDIYITDLYNVTFSPSGKYLFAIRQNSLGIYEPIAWKMPSSDNILYQPVVISAPEGATIETWLTAYINDYGIITANGSVEGQTRGIVWTMNEYGNSLEGAILPNLSGDNYANVIGLSNHSAPIVAGNALNAEYQERATVWKYISPTSFSPMDLEALPNGNASQIVKISPNGTLAGVANTLHEDELKQHIICAIPVIPSSSDSIDPTLYRLTPQGEPYSNGAIISHVTNTGEIIANIYSSANDPELFLLSKGKSHSLASSIPKSSGYELREIIGANAQGSLLVTALKDSALETMILTPDRDTDGDGLPDAWENPHQFNPFSKNSSNADTDNDGLTDLLEYANNTHPRIPDTDGDGMKDGWEVEWGFLPLDPHDAQLDPDEDRVTNLRESQIGTVPTGVYKVETRHIDTDWQFPQILAAGDDGTIVRSGGYTYHVIDENYEYGYDYSQNVFALPPVASNVTFQLPDNRHSFYYNGDWTQFLYSNSRANYFSDSASGKIHADRYHHLHQSGPIGGENIYEEAYFLTPDITNFPNESDWISLETVENNLRNPDLHNSFPPLSDSESLNRNAACVSPSGIRRLYRSSDWSKQLLLNQRGEFVEHLSNDLNWQVINDQGLAAGIVINEGPETPYSGCSHLPWLFLSDGQSLLLPHDPSSSIFPDWALLSYSNDGKILLRNFYQNVQSIWTYRFFLYDSTTGRLDRIRLPASAYSSVSSLSNQNGRMLIQGSKPSQITPDGTCIRLDALRVTDEIHGTPVPLRELYPNIITPSHISSDGRITLTTTNSNGNNVIIQITSYNDANNDGLPDDWTQAHNVTNPDADDDGDRLSNRREYELGTDPKKEDTDNDGILDSIDGNPKVPATPTTDSDGDGVFDLDDAVPNDAEINWKKTPEAKYVWVEQVIHDESVGEPIAINKHAQILFSRTYLSYLTEQDQNKILWSSKSQQWINLPTVGTMPIQSPQKFILEMDIDSEDFELKSEYYDDINDEGKVFGISNGDALTAGMIWEKSPESETYSNPKYIFPKFPLRKIGEQDGDPVYRYGIKVMGGRIAHDGTISAITTEGYDEGLAWSLKDGNATADNMSMKKEKNIESGYSYVGSILDKDRALLIEDPWSEENFRIWLKEISGLTDISFMGGDFAEMSELPLDVNGRIDRLWISTGTNCHIEKRNGGVGAARWHKPASMEGERIIRVSKQGVAITAGNTWQSSPPKLWRNGTYTNLNDTNLTAKPADVKITNAIDIASNGIILVQATEGAVKKTGILLPIEVIELSPKVKNENGHEIVNSEKPVVLPKYNELIEEIELKNEVDQNRIAHREMKVKIHRGSMIAGKKITWTMKAWGVKEADDFRGDWKHSKVKEHKNRFEESKNYGKYGYKPDNQESCETKIEAMSDDGFTAIRVNVPPIGWNHAEIKMKIEGAENEIPIIRFVVPAVVVVDAGHGGDADITDQSLGTSRWNNAKGGYWNTTISGKKKYGVKTYDQATGVLEKTLTLPYSVELEKQLRAEHIKLDLPLRIYQTRTSDDDNFGGYIRARVARDNGADLFLSLHFNAVDGPNVINARGTLVTRRVKNNNNVNYAEDVSFEERIVPPVNAALFAIDNIPRTHITPHESGNAVTSDVLGYYQDDKYHPIRSTLLEIDFIHNESGDKLINGVNKDRAKQNSMKALAGAILEELTVFKVQNDN